MARLKHGRATLGPMAGSALNVGFAYFDWRGRVREGQNPALAGAVAAGSAFLGATMGTLPYLAVTMGPALMRTGTQAYMNYYREHSVYTRRMATPFSHRFGHTDATYQMQQRGLQQLTGARGALGAEAGMMAQLYARR